MFCAIRAKRLKENEVQFSASTFAPEFNGYNAGRTARMEFAKLHEHNIRATSGLRKDVVVASDPARRQIQNLPEEKATHTVGVANDIR